MLNTVLSFPPKNRNVLFQMGHFSIIYISPKNKQKYTVRISIENRIWGNTFQIWNSPPNNAPRINTIPVDSLKTKNVAKVFYL